MQGFRWLVRTKFLEYNMGLTEAEVRDRIQKGQENIQVDPSTRTYRQIIKDNVFTYFNLIFVVLALLLVLVGSFKNLTFMLIVVANTAVGIFQEIRSKKTLEKLKLLKMPKAHAIRDGREVEVATGKLVLDDVIVLRSGNQIPADATVLEGSVQVNEALLTGEADEITKTIGDSLLSGSFVVSGECYARLTAVGRESYISKLTLEATNQGKSEDSEMILSLDKMVKVIGIIIIPVGMIMLVQHLVVLGTSFRDSVIAIVAAILGMIPEGLYMTASIAMVVSALKLAKKNVLVQNLRCIEALARVDTLLVDKTGTITSGDMKVAGFTQIDESIPREELSRLMGTFVHEQSADSTTMEALQNYFTETNPNEAAVSICPFSSRYKYSGACFVNGNYVMGAPEYVMGSTLDKYSEYINKMSGEGYRVLAFCRIQEEPRGQVISGASNLLALLFLANPVRENANETFKYFAENGVEIKVISGDNPVTVSHVASQAGIQNADRYVDARTLVNERAVYDAIQRYTVFGRVSPEQKRQFVWALQEQEKTVGMTGDGVNDILALREADCSVAMASGSEAAANAAQLVLLDSDFGQMPSVVSEGRRVVNNIQKAASLYLTKNIFSLLLALFSMISVLSYPLKPSQITLISMFTIGVPSFILSLEPNFNKIKGKFLPNVFKMAAPAGITMFISVSAMVIFGQVFKIEDSCISTSATMLVALVGFLFLGKVAVPRNRLHVGMIAILILGMAYCVIFMPQLFDIDAITMKAAMLLVVFLIATEGLFRYVHRFVEVSTNVSEQRQTRKAEKRAAKIRQRKRRAAAKAADEVAEIENNQ